MGSFIASASGKAAFHTGTSFAEFGFTDFHSPLCLFVLIAAALAGVAALGSASSSSSVLLSPLLLLLWSLGV